MRTLHLSVVAGVVTTVTFAGGCTRDSIPPPPTPTDGSARSVAVGSVGLEDDWPELTRAELQSLHDERMQEMAKSLGVDMPDHLPPVTFVSVDSWPQYQVSCLQDAGFDAVIRQGGVALGSVPPEQASALKQTMFSCEYQSAVDPRISAGPLPRVAAVRLYEHQVQSVNCIRSQGYEPEDPPTLDLWLADYASSEESLWDPYTVVGNDVFALEELQNSCPPTPPDLYPPLPEER